jgi:hypothetical protein
MADPEQARAANDRSLAFAEHGLVAEALTESAQAVTLYRQLIAAHVTEAVDICSARNSADPDGDASDYGDTHEKAVRLRRRLLT